MGTTNGSSIQKRTSHRRGILNLALVFAVIALLSVPALTPRAGAAPRLGSVVLIPPSQTVTTGDTATLTAIAQDTTGKRLSGVMVSFSVTGANPMTIGPVTSDALGRATASYQGTKAGSDTVTAIGTYNVQTIVSNSVIVNWLATTGSTLTLSPASTTTAVGSTATVTATVKNPDGSPASGKVVRFTVTGTNPATASQTTTGAGQASYTESSKLAGTDTIFAYADLDNDGFQDANEPAATATVVWTAANLTLTTTGASAAVGSTQTVTATVISTTGDALAGVKVYFTVTGANPRSGSDTTDANGQAHLTYTGSASGKDTITAFADLNANGTQSSDEPSSTTTITWSASTLSLSPIDANFALGTTQTIVATVKDASGKAMNGVMVRYTITGVNPISGSAQTNADGQASISVTGKHAGVDTLTTYADIDNDNEQQTGEPGASTTMHWSNATLTLAPLSATQALGVAQAFTATVKNTNGDPLSGISVLFTVTGANPTTGSDTTNANGEAHFSFTGMHPGVDRVIAFADVDQDKVQDATEPEARTTLTWSNASLGLSAPAGSQKLGSTQSVTATLKNSAGNGLSGVTVFFTVTGANPGSGSGKTDANGQAVFSYTGNHVGTDTIAAYADLDADKAQDANDPTASATLTWGTTPTPPATPSAFQPAQPKAGCTYFAITQHNLCAGFQAYWNQFGGLPVYGYPLTEEFVENGQTVQYFERARFEWHPGAWPARYDVELGLLGNELTGGMRSNPAFQPAAAQAGCTYFAETKHNLCAQFQTYWNQFGGLPVYGYPISEPFQQNGMTVQYFERARFEWHPGAWQSRYDVLLGRVGAEVLAEKYP